MATWGDKETGGDSSRCADQLKDVREIQANSESFAAILANGSVATGWQGDAVLCVWPD